MSTSISIILLAMVAAFLGLRLYSVLGKRTGHEQEPMSRQPLEERSAPVVRPPVADNQPSNPMGSSQHIDIDHGAESGLRSIMNADRQFDPSLFIEGAKAAYKMILEAFWKGDRQALEFLCDDDVLQGWLRNGRASDHPAGRCVPECGGRGSAAANICVHGP